MATAGEIDALRREDGETVYRRCGADHHHHLTCRTCRPTIEVTAPPVEGWARDVAATHGFVDVHHVIELVGLCPDCAATAEH